MLEFSEQSAFAHCPPSQNLEEFGRNFAPSYELNFGFYGKTKELDEESWLESAYAPKQVHQTTILEAGPACQGKFEDSPKADGLWTTNTKTKLAIQTADCLPVLFYDINRPVILAVHAGWRGLVAGILESAVAVATANGSRPEHLVAMIGPAISQENYEIDEAVHSVFLKHPLYQNFAQASFMPSPFHKGTENRYLLSLKAWAIQALHNAGIPYKQLFHSSICTFRENKTWHSYRKKQRSCQVTSGRNWSWIST